MKDKETFDNKKMALNFPDAMFRSFEKGLGQRGCREEILPMPEIEASFLRPFPMPP